MMWQRKPVLQGSQRTTAIWIALLGYFILVGGTPGSEFNGWIRALNGAIAVGLIVRWVLSLASDNDGIDRGMLLALLAFLAACVVSTFPRQSFDAAIQATALVAAFYFARRRLANVGRAEIESAAGWLCVGLAAIVCVAWGRGWIEWLTLSGGSAPPISLPLVTGPFGHRHDVALLVAILAPSMWTPRFRQRRAVAIAGTILVVAVVLADSSRNVELAVLAASIATLLVRRVRISARALRIGSGIAAAAVFTTAIFVLQTPVLVSRIANLGNIVARFSLWGEGATVWLAHPLAGLGPGSFPFALMLSDYFRTSLFNPRHPDNAIVQLLVEGGVIGLVAGLVCVGTLIRGAHLRWRDEPRAVWALLVFAFATFGANPTDFVFLVVPTLIWMAILVPVGDDVPLAVGPSRRHAPPSRMKMILVSASAVIVVAVSVTGAAGVSYEIGRSAYLRGEDTRAEAALDISAALDPSLAIYPRERASLAFAEGELSRAEAGYRQSLRISPFDPVAWRGLALALLADSDFDGAAFAADRAVNLMFLSPQSQLVRAATARADPLEYATAMEVALHAQPWLPVLSWDDTVLAFADRAAVAHQGVDGVFRALMADRADLATLAVKTASPFLRRTTAALAALASCNLELASDLMEEAARVEGEEAGFWIARPLVTAAASPTGPQRARITAMSVWFLGVAPKPRVVSALAGDMSDMWRYRRISLGVAAEGAALPSDRAARWYLLNDPAVALQQLGTSWPPGCSLNP